MVPLILTSTLILVSRYCWSRWPKGREVKKHCRRCLRLNINHLFTFTEVSNPTMGSSDNFRLRWNDFESNVLSSFRQHRADSEFLDVTLVTTDNGPRTLRAHKVRGHSNNTWHFFGNFLTPWHFNFLNCYLRLIYLELWKEKSRKYLLIDFIDRFLNTITRDLFKVFLFYFLACPEFLLQLFQASSSPAVQVEPASQSVHLPEGDQLLRPGPRLGLHVSWRSQNHSRQFKGIFGIGWRTPDQRPDQQVIICSVFNSRPFRNNFLQFTVTSFIDDPSWATVAVFYNI